MVNLNFYNESNFNNYLSELANWHTCENSTLYLDKVQLIDSVRDCNEIVVCRFCGKVCELKDQLSYVRLYNLFPKANGMISIIIQYSSKMILSDMIDVISIISDMVACKENYALGFTAIHDECDELSVDIVIPIRIYVNRFKYLMI